MRFHTVALLTGATAAAAGNTATLLLPGFEGHDLQAGVLGAVGARYRGECLPENSVANNRIRPVMPPPTW